MRFVRFVVSAERLTKAEKRSSTTTTNSLPSSAAAEILDKQRLRRPSSPHFTIYQPQLTWIASIANRVTGAGLSVCEYHLEPCRRGASRADPLTVLYGFSIAYLVAPGTFDSPHVVEFVAGLPEGVKYAGKAILAAPFAFHSLNGLRHLGWDMGKCELLMHSQSCPMTNNIVSRDGQRLLHDWIRRPWSNSRLYGCFDLDEINCKSCNVDSPCILIYNPLYYPRSDTWTLPLSDLQPTESPVGYILSYPWNYSFFFR